MGTGITVTSLRIVLWAFVSAPSIKKFSVVSESGLLHRQHICRGRRTLTHHVSLDRSMVGGSHRSSEDCGFVRRLGIRNRFSQGMCLMNDDIASEMTYLVMCSTYRPFLGTMIKIQFEFSGWINLSMPAT